MAKRVPTSRTLPLAGIKVIEFAGLALGPMAGMILADFGADVVRVDRPGKGPAVAPDVLCRGKRSIAVDQRTTSGKNMISRLINNADVLIDPFRPGVMERMDIGPDVFLGEEGTNKKLVYARLSGFSRTGEHKNMAGHDLNYLALSGVLPLMPGEDKPMFPANLLADFGGGGLTCALGILLALFERERSGLGQVVETDMVSGTRYLSTYLMLAQLYVSPPLSGPRGKAVLDGGSPFYNVYTCADGRWMTVACLEPEFFRVFLDVFLAALPQSFGGAGGWRPTMDAHSDTKQWEKLKGFLVEGFKLHPRDHWAQVFLGTDACCAPVLNLSEAAVTASESAESPSMIPRPHPHLSTAPTPVLNRPSAGSSTNATVLEPGAHTDEILAEMGLTGEEKRELRRDGALGKELGAKL